MVPLAPLAELAAHEQQLLARVRPHERQVGAQVGELLPAIPGHLVDQRAFAVDHFVVGNRQDEVLGIGVDHAEGHLVVVVLPIDRVFLDVLQRVMHPAHVPLVGEAETTFAGGLADPWKGRRFLGDHQRAGGFRGHHVVQMTEEIDRLEVLAPAVAVRDPLALLARVVAIEHRRHRIDTQGIDVEFTQPVQRRSEHETMHLGAAEIVDVGIPVLMEALERVRVFV